MRQSVCDLVSTGDSSQTLTYNTLDGSLDWSIYVCQLKKTPRSSASSWIWSNDLCGSCLRVILHRYTQLYKSSSIVILLLSRLALLRVEFLRTPELTVYTSGRIPQANNILHNNEVNGRIAVPFDPKVLHEWRICFESKNVRISMPFRTATARCWSCSSVR